MKENLLNNLGIKILSLCLAAMFWLAIVNIDDPVKSKTFYNVPVEVKNEDTLASRNMAYDIVSGSAVEFTVSGKRSVVDELRKSDFMATADLATLTQQFDSIKINVECLKNADIDIIMGKVSTMTVSVEDIIDKQFAIRVVPSGQPAPGFAAGTPIASPLFVNVSGARSVVNQIDDVRVLVDIKNKSEDITDSVIPRAYNETGLEIDRSRLKFSYDTITVKIPLLETKMVPVNLITKGTPRYGYQYVQADFQPLEIEVKGSKEALEKINSIPVVVDINDLYQDKEDIINIEEFLAENDVTLVDEHITDVVVKVRIEKLIEKTFSITANELNVNNLTEGYEYFNIDTQREYKVTVMGLKDVIDSLELSTLRPTIDLGGLKVGRNNVSITLTIPDGITLVKSDKVKLEIKKQNDSDEPEPSPTPTPSKQPVEDDKDEEVEPSIPVTPPDDESGSEDDIGDGLGNV